MTVPGHNSESRSSPPRNARGDSEQDKEDVMSGSESAKGRMKEAVGTLIDDEELQHEGEAQRKRDEAELQTRGWTQPKAHHPAWEERNPMELVLLVTFAREGAAGAGRRRLEQLRDSGALKIHTVATVRRDAEGLFEVVDTEGRGMEAAATGGIAGALIGALVGPVGALVGGVTGAAVGTAAGSEEAAESEGIAGRMTQLVPPRATALIAEVDEFDAEAVDVAMGPIGGDVTRRRREGVTS
ncbi:MAG: hypothetical protein ACRDZ3_13285 [Acidimicrobiia bacterium]